MGTVGTPAAAAASAMMTIPRMMCRRMPAVHSSVVTRIVLVWKVGVLVGLLYVVLSLEALRPATQNLALRAAEHHGAAQLVARRELAIHAAAAATAAAVRAGGDGLVVRPCYRTARRVRARLFRSLLLGEASPIYNSVQQRRVTGSNRAFTGRSLQPIGGSGCAAALVDRRLYVERMPS